MSTRIPFPLTCEHCEERKKRTELGIQISDMHIYCLEHEQFNTIPLSHQSEIMEHIENQNLMTMLYRSISVRLKPYMALHVAKQLQNNPGASLSSYLTSLIVKDMKENDLSDVELLGYAPEMPPEGQAEFIKPKAGTENKPMSEVPKLKPKLDDEQPKRKTKIDLEPEPEKEPEPEPVKLRKRKEDNDDLIGDLEL